MKIGDRIYVRGYVDEIRKDTVIVRNDGGYFGTILSEVTPSAQPEPEDCDTCKHGYFGDEECNNCRVGYPSHYERRTDDKTNKGSSC